MKSSLWLAWMTMLLSSVATGYNNITKIALRIEMLTLLLCTLSIVSECQGDQLSIGVTGLRKEVDNLHETPEMLGPTLHKLYWSLTNGIRKIGQEQARSEFEAAGFPVTITDHEMEVVLAKGCHFQEVLVPCDIVACFLFADNMKTKCLDVSAILLIGEDPDKNKDKDILSTKSPFEDLFESPDLTERRGRFSSLAEVKIGYRVVSFVRTPVDCFGFLIQLKYVNPSDPAAFRLLTYSVCSGLDGIVDVVSGKHAKPTGTLVQAFPKEIQAGHEFIKGPRNARLFSFEGMAESRPIEQ